MRTLKVVFIVVLGLSILSAQPIFAQAENPIINDSMPLQLNREEVLFVREINGRPSIWVMSSDGSEAQMLINDPNGGEIALIRPLDSHAEVSEIAYLFSPVDSESCILRVVRYPDVENVISSTSGVACDAKWYLPDHPTDEDYRSLEGLSEPFDGKMYNYAEDAGTSSLVGTCISPENETPHLCWYDGIKGFINESDLEGENFRMGFNSENQTGYYFDFDGKIYWYDPEEEIPTLDLTSVNL